MLKQINWEKFLTEEILHADYLGSYEYKGYCTARLSDYRKCQNFEEHEVGQGICKFLLFGGACGWKPDTMDLVVDIFDCKPDNSNINEEEK